MKLKFVPRKNAMVRYPENRVDGAPVRYIGRELKIVDGSPIFPAAQSPFECESSNNLAKIGGYLAHYTCKRDGDLLPFDEETAKFCGVPYKQLAWKDGVWAEASKTVESLKEAVKDNVEVVVDFTEAPPRRKGK